jgi:hypothetical protein
MIFTGRLARRPLDGRSLFEESERKAKRVVALAQARVSTRNLRIEVDRKWFWSFTGETLDLLRACAADAKKRGATSDAHMIERHVSDMCDQLEAIQAKETKR